MKTTTFAAALVSMLLSACMAPPHMPPQAGPTAELMVVRAEGSTNARLFIHLLDGPQCAAKRALEFLDFNSHEPRLTTISAGRRTQLVLKEISSATRSECRVALDFDALPGRRYRATWHGAHSRCFVQLETVNAVDGKELLQSESSAKLNYNGC